MSFPRQPDFGWSYPPGCNSVPADNEEPDANEEPDFDPSYDTEEETEPPWA